MKKISAKQALEALKTEVAQYAAVVRARRGVVHSQTPSVIVKNDVKGAATLQIMELITVVQTAKALGKHVVLESNDKTLVINLVDSYPSIPYHWGN